MPFVITFHDDEGVIDKKRELRALHLDYVNSNAGRIIASGGLFPDDDDFPNGGLIVLDVTSRAEAVSYIENDPFFLNGIFSRYSIDRWKAYIFDRRRAAV